MTYAFDKIFIKVFSDPNVSELLINGSNRTELIRSHNTVEAIDLGLSDHDILVRSVQQFARQMGQRLDTLEPANGGDWSDSSSQLHLRWHCVLPPIAPRGPLLSIRRHRFDKIELEDFLLEPTHFKQIRDWMHKNDPILICGPTGSGKSTLLAAILNHYCQNERIIILEQVLELPCLNPRWTQMVARQPNFEGLGGFSMSRALEESLRLRPDRIIVGEVRGRESEALLQTLLSGHAGVITTLHASNVDDALQKLRSLVSPRLRNLSAKIWPKFGIIIMGRGTPPRVLVAGKASIDSKD